MLFKILLVIFITSPFSTLNKTLINQTFVSGLASNISSRNVNQKLNFCCLIDVLQWHLDWLTNLRFLSLTDMRSSDKSQICHRFISKAMFGSTKFLLTSLTLLTLPRECQKCYQRLTRDVKKVICQPRFLHPQKFAFNISFRNDNKVQAQKVLLLTFGFVWVLGAVTRILCYERMSKTV